MDTSNLWSLVKAYAIVTVPMMIVIPFLNAFLQPLSQWAARRIWLKIFQLLGKAEDTPKVEKENKLP